MATRLSHYRAAPPASFEQRAEPRHRVLLTRATVANRRSRPIEAMLHDVSTYGCRLICRTRHAEGERIWLRFTSEPPVAATLVWNDGEQIGCRFDAPIARNLMRSLTLVIA